MLGQPVDMECTEGLQNGHKPERVVALDHELPEAAVVPVVQRSRRLLRPEDLRDDVPRPPEDGLVLSSLSLPPQLAQDLPLRLPQARLAKPLGGLVAVPDVEWIRFMNFDSVPYFEQLIQLQVLL